jgi:lysozyme family protein
MTIYINVGRREEMAEFKKYAKILIQLEGGYTNHPDDLGRY